MENEIKELIRLYEKSGRIAFLYPRLKKVSLNGGKREPIETAKIKIKNCLKKEGLI